MKERNLWTTPRVKFPGREAPLMLVIVLLMVFEQIVKGRRFRAMKAGSPSERGCESKEGNE